MTRDEWFGRIQTFLEDRIKDAPDEACAAFASELWDKTAEDDIDEPVAGGGDPNCAHEWAYTGTAYGGDDTRWHGEGRCYCTKCGADGDA